MHLFFFLFFQFANNSNAQWHHKGPFFGSNQYGSFYIKSINNSLFGIENFIQANSGSSGLYESTNNGNNWTRLNTPGVNCYDIVYQNGNLIIGTNKGVYRSIDNGINWLYSNTNISPQDSITGFKLLKINNRILIYGTSLYYSDNDGITWNNIQMNHPMTYFHTILHNNSIIAACTGGIYVSNDNALTWQNSNTGLLNDTILREVISNNNSLFCRAGNNKVFKSVNNGASWTLSNSGLPIGSYINFFNVNSKLYLVSQTNTFEYDSVSNSWSQSLLCQTELVSLRGYENGVYFGASLNHDGLIKSSNEGLTWTTCNDTIERMNVSKLGTIYNSLYALCSTGGYVFDTINQTFVRSSPYNFNFSANSYVQTGVNDIKISNTGTIYLATAGGVWKSVNGGLNYTQTYANIPYTSLTSTYIVYDLYLSGTAPNDTLFAATDNGIYMSTDDAVSFSLVTGTDGGKMQQFLKYQNILYCAGTKMYKQTNPNTWVQFANFTSASGITGFTATDDYLFVSNSTSLVKYAHVNGLSNFTNITTGSLIAAYSVAAYDTLVFYFSEAGVFKLNTGLLGSATQADVVQIAANLPYYYLPTFPTQTKFYSYLDHGFGMAVFNGKLWLGTKGMSTFYRSLNDFGYNITVGENTTAAIDYASQLYPNPTTDKIYFKDISKSSTVTIYNNLGQLQQTSIYQNNEGIDVSNLAKGFYFYTITNKEHNTSGKFVKE